MQKIDTHCHLHNPEYHKELKQRGWTGNRVIRVDSREAASRDWKEYADARIASMDRLEIARQVATSSFSILSQADNAFHREWAQANNDFLANICRRNPDRFSAFAGVPLPDVTASISELRRVAALPGIVGIQLHTHIGKTMLDDPELLPFYQEMDKLGLTLFIHPTLPLGYDEIPQYRRWASLYQFIGYLFDTTMTFTRLTYAGILEKCPRINMIASHMGGMLPFVYHSIDIMREEMALDGKDVPPRQPGEYFKRLYADTARPLKAATLQCALALFGEDHILFGSDMPFWTEGFDAPKRIITEIEAMDLPVATEDKIFYNNAQRLFKL